MAVQLRRSLGLALVMILAGCGGLLGSDPGDMSHATITAAPVPTDTPTPFYSARDVPGLTEHGIENAFELGRAHRVVLTGQSYTQWTNETSRFANGTLRLRSVSVTRLVPAEDEPRFRRETTYEGPVSPTVIPYRKAARIKLYGETRVYLRATFANGTTAVQSLDRSGVQSWTLELVLSAFETRIAGTTACGNRTCYLVRSTSLETPAYLTDALVRIQDRDVRNGSLLAVVDERGLVREYRVRYLVETPTRRYTAVRRVRYTAIGETVVERPDWVGKRTNG